MAISYCARFLINSLSGSRALKMGYFGDPKCSICPKKEFFGESLILFPSTYWSLSLCKILKNYYNGYKVMRMRHFWTQNGPICRNENFFRKPVNKPCSYYSCLSMFQKSKSDIKLLMKYCQFRNTEISLPKSHFWP